MLLPVCLWCSKDLEWFAWWCTLSNYSPLIQKAQNLSLCKSISTRISAFPGISVALTPAMSQVNDYSSLHFFCLVHLESVFKSRLSTLKILLELYLELCVHHYYGPKRLAKGRSDSILEKISIILLIPKKSWIFRGSIFIVLSWSAIWLYDD